MDTIKPAFLALLAMTASLASAAAADLPPLIPLRDFFRNPEKTHFRLSPDGTRFAYLAPWENRLNIFVQKVDAGADDAAVRVTEAKDRDISESEPCPGGRCRTGRQSTLWKNPRRKNRADLHLAK